MSGENGTRIERSHYVLQRSLYFTEEEDLGAGRVFLAEGISEPQWNHLALVSVATAAELDALLEQAEQLLGDRGLASAVEVGPSSRPADLGPRLADRGYELAYRYTWLLAGASVPQKFQCEARSEIELHTVTTPSEVDAFFAVFQAVYPEDLEPGYERTLRRPSTSMASCEVVHHLALYLGEPAAVATSIHGRSGAATSVTGLYNLAVHPDHRSRGLGAMLTGHRVTEARRRGQELIFLQTEREPVARWQRRHGFRFAFVTESYALSEETP